MRGVTQTTVVAAPRAEVWARVTSFEGINHELGPWMRMTAPKHLRTIDEVNLGERVCRSWVLLLGVIPFDYDDLTLVRIEPDVGFLERSKMLSQRFWEHERTLEDADGGTRVTDRLRFQPRLKPMGGVSSAVVKRIFGHRHRRLAEFFGT